jgi:hypothetical protein
MKPVTLIKMCLNETYRKLHISKHLAEKFPIQNNLGGGEIRRFLFPLILNFALEYRKTGWN